MDLTFKTNSGVFNYRVCAIIKQNNKLLSLTGAGNGGYNESLDMYLLLKNINSCDIIFIVNRNQ